MINLKGKNKHASPKTQPNNKGIIMQFKLKSTKKGISYLKIITLAITIFVSYLFGVSPAFAYTSLQYELRGYGAVSDYAFNNMNQPEFGASLKISDNHRGYIVIHSRMAARNQDINGGIAGVFSIYAGNNFIHTKLLTLPLTAGVYSGYQHLWYGHLYNNGIGGGARLQVRISKLILTGKISALYGLSGTVGWHLNCPGNDFIFYGRATYPATKKLSVYAFIRQERYIGNGNALTARDAGFGIGYKFS